MLVVIAIANLAGVRAREKLRLRSVSSRRTKARNKQRYTFIRVVSRLLLAAVSNLLAQVAAFIIRELVKGTVYTGTFASYIKRGLFFSYKCL